MHGSRATVADLQRAAAEVDLALPPGLPGEATPLAALPPVLAPLPSPSGCSVELVQRCGPGSGRRWPLWPATWALGRRGPQPHHGEVPALRVDGPGQVWCRPGSSQSLLVDGHALTEPVRLVHGSTITDGVRLWQVRLATAEGSEVTPVSPPVPPDEPAPPSSPSPISWAAVVLPLVGGGLAAVLFGPLMAVMSGMAALVAVGRHVEVKVRHRRALARHREALAELRAAHADDCRRVASVEHRRRWLNDSPQVLVGSGIGPWDGVELQQVPIGVDLPGRITVIGPANVTRSLCRHLALEAARLTGRSVRGFDEPWELWWPDHPQPVQVGFAVDRAEIDVGGPDAVVVQWMGDGTARLVAQGLQQVAIPPVVDALTADALARDLARFAQRSALPPSVNLADLLGPPSSEEVARRWTDSRGLESVWCTAADGPFVVDLVRDGPHALVAGTTGAGKSELLRSWVVSMAASHDPARVHLVLVDFKGGGAFDAVSRLPHVAAVVTDLDEHLAERALVGLRAELTGREHRLRTAGVGDLRDWPEAAGAAPARLVVVVDELATLVAELPAFVDGLVDIAQRGRSLGIHLVLATQRPAGVVTSAVRANVNLRIALRVQSAADAVDVIDDVAAAGLPPLAGRALVRVGNDPVAVVQAGWVSGPWVEPTAVSLWPERADPVALPVRGRELDEWVEAIAAAAHGFTRPAAPWPAPLPDQLSLGEIDDGSFAMADHPERQCHQAVRWVPDAGHLLVVGADGGQVVRSAVAAATSVGSGRCRVIGIDGGGGLLMRSLAGADGVALVASTGDEAALGRVVRVCARAVAGTDLTWSGPTIVVVDQLVAVFEVLDQMDRHLRSELVEIMRRGAAHGVWFVLTASSPRGVPSTVSDLCGMRVVHQLADPAAALTAGVKLDEAGWLVGARAIVLPARDRVVVARPDPGQAVGASAVGAVRVLGERVGAAELPAAQVRERGVWVPVGLDPDLDPVGVTIGRGTTLLVAGGAGSGVTNTLRVIARQAAGLLEVVWVDGSTGMSDLDALGPDSLVIVDDADLVSSAVGQVIAGHVWSERPDRPPIVVGGHTDGLRKPGHWTAPARAGRSAVILRPAPGDGDVVRASLPIRSTDRWPTGRALVSEGSGWRVVQVGEARESAGISV